MTFIIVKMRKLVNVFMKMYEKGLIIDIIETKILQMYPEYFPQGQYNNVFISYLYKYLRDNTYSGEHNVLYNELLSLKKISPTLTIKESTDRRTYTLTDTNIISSDVITSLNLILRRYYNYNFIVRSANRIVFEVLFGWLPPNAGSWLNLLNSEVLVDYYIDGITLRPNTHTVYGGKPDSGYVCYRINDIREYNTMLFLINDELKIEGKITFASLLNDIEGRKGATLNRIIETDPKNALYELGPYTQNYLSAEDAALIIQIPYEYAISDALYVFDVSHAVLINPQNNPNDPNDSINWYVALDDPDYDSKFIYNNLNKSIVEKIINSDTNILSTTLNQYIFGDFIWKTADSKLIAYAQNLINSLFPTAVLTPDGIWSDSLSNYVRRFKEAYGINSLFDDDVIDKSTEELMTTMYKRTFNRDFNLLFNEW